MQMNLATVRQLMIEQNPWAKAAGIEVLEVGPASVRLRMAPSKIIENPFGAYHAGALYTFGETAAACLTIVAFDMSAGRTVLMKAGQIDYGKVVRETLRIDATATPAQVQEVNTIVSEQGKHNFPLTVVMKTEAEDEMCRATYTVHMRKTQPPK